MEVRTPSAGKITKIYTESGQEVNVGEALFDLEPSAEGVAAPAAPKAEAAPAKKAAEPTKAAPAAAAPAKKEAAKPAAAPVATPAGDRTETRVKMTRMRQRISQRLKEAQNTAAMLTTFQEVDMSALIEMRNQHKESFEKTHGVKLGFMSAFVRVRFVLKLFLYDIYILYVYCVIVLLIILLACTLLLPTGLYRRPAGDPCRQRRDRRLHQRDCLSQLCRCLGRRGFPQWLSRACAAQH